jgi:two-component system nitrogen regulation response regulator GlnG
MAPALVIEPKDLPSESAGDSMTAPTRGDDATMRAQTVSMPATAVPSSVPMTTAGSWLDALEREARAKLAAGDPDVWGSLTRDFESRLIRTALDTTRGRRIEAAQRLHIGRNTITRKIQELGIED